MPPRFPPAKPERSSFQYVRCITCGECSLSRAKNSASESEPRRTLRFPRTPGTGNVAAVPSRQAPHGGQLLAADETHAPHVTWPLARSTTTAGRNSLGPFPPRDKAGTCIPSALRMLDANPGLILADWGWNSLASFTGNAHACIPRYRGASQPAKRCFPLRADFWQNSHCRTPALTEVNGYHLATLGSTGLIFLALRLFLLLAQENSAFALYLVIQEPECP